MYGVDAFVALQLRDGYAGQFGGTGPFALAGYHEVQIEFADQRPAVRARRVVDAGKTSSSNTRRGAWA